MQLTNDLDPLLQPKRHLWIHALLDMNEKGNPRFFANWHGGGLNKVLRACCRQPSQLTFEPNLLIDV